MLQEGDVPLCSELASLRVVDLRWNRLGHLQDLTHLPALKELHLAGELHGA